MTSEGNDSDVGNGTTELELTAPQFDSIGRILVERGGYRPMRRPGAWAADGLCRETDPDLWYPPNGGNGNDAKAICQICAVKVECLDWALRNNEPEGIWGGLSPQQRTKLRKGAA